MSTELLKPAQVAKRLGVSRSWLYDAGKVGMIPSVRLGGPDGPLRFVAEDLDAWLEDARGAPIRATRDGSKYADARDARSSL